MMDKATREASRRAQMQARDDAGRFKEERKRAKQQFKKIGAYPTKKINGQNIPYNSSGRVPAEMMAARLNQMNAEKGPLADLKRKAKKLIRRNPTPEEAVVWWEDPSCCDVEGIDDPNSDLFMTEDLQDPDSQKKIAVLAKTEKDQLQIRKDIESAFTSKQLKAMGCVTIVSTKDLGENAGATAFRTENRPSDMIYIDPECVNDKETVVHEAVHLSRLRDRSRGLIKRSVNKDRTGRSIKVTPVGRAAEEAATIIETKQRLRK